MSHSGRRQISTLCLHGIGLFAQTITVTVDVSDPTDADAVAFLVPFAADRNITAPQKFKWCLKGSSGAGYLTTGKTSLT